MSRASWRHLSPRRKRARCIILAVARRTPVRFSRRSKSRRDSPGKRKIIPIWSRRGPATTSVTTVTYERCTHITRRGISRSHSKRRFGRSSSRGSVGKIRETRWRIVRRTASCNLITPAVAALNKYMRFQLTLLVCLLSLAPIAHATTVVPPSFPELVAEADGIYRGRVTSIQARRVPLPEGDGSVIKTFVTFTVERVLKGPEQAQLTLEFLGGTIGDETVM